MRMFVVVAALAFASGAAAFAGTSAALSARAVDEIPATAPAAVDDGERALGRALLAAGASTADACAAVPDLI